MYITLEVFYLKHSGENINVIKIQKITFGQHLILMLYLIIEILSSSLDTFTDDQPGEEWIMCGFGGKIIILLM